MDTRSDSGAVAAIVRRRLWVVVVAFVAAIGAALLYSAQQDKQYRSTSVLLFRQVLLDVQLTGVPLVLPSSDASVESATNIGLVSQENVRVAAAAALGPDYTPDRLEDDVEIEPQRKSNLVGIKATADTPQAAARVANAMATSYLQIARQQTVSRINSAADQVRSRITHQKLTEQERRSLRESLIKLNVLASLGPQYVQLVQPAVPPAKAFSPKPLRNALIGGVIGLVIGLALAFGVEHFDRRLRQPEEVERESGLPLLATVPRSSWLRGPLRARPPDQRAIESLRQLASHLRHGPGDRAIHSVLITAASPGSGTTTVALHLAVAAAEDLAERVFLLEANLRRPALAGLLDLPSGNGLGAPSPDRPGEQPTVHTVDVGDVEGDGSLSVMLASARAGHGSALLESRAVGDLMRTSNGRYDLTVVDGPPPLLVADAIPLAKEADAVVIVARLGKDTGADIRRLRVELERRGVVPLGVVANYARKPKASYPGISRG